MTIIDAIHRVDGIKPNGFQMQEKLFWLSTLDGYVKSELLDPRAGAPAEKFAGYGEHTPLTQELLVPHPYDELYIRYLEVQIDCANGEYEKYNNSTALFNAAWEAYAKFVARTQKPRAQGFIHF